MFWFLGQWVDTVVAAPMLSTKLRANGCEAILYHEAGDLINPHKGISSKIDESGGVYLMKMLVPKSMTHPGHPAPKTAPPAAGFVRQDAAA